jgi:hypothetical protein
VVILYFNLLWLVLALAVEGMELAFREVLAVVLEELLDAAVVAAVILICLGVATTQQAAMAEMVLFLSGLGNLGNM